MSSNRFDIERLRYFVRAGYRSVRVLQAMHHTTRSYAKKDSHMRVMMKRRLFI